MMGMPATGKNIDVQLIDIINFGTTVLRTSNGVSSTH